MLLLFKQFKKIKVIFCSLNLKSFRGELTLDDTMSTNETYLQLKHIKRSIKMKANNSPHLEFNAATDIATNGRIPISEGLQAASSKVSA